MQNASVNTFPENETFGHGITCRFSKPGTCGRDAEICAFKMSNKTNAQIADCSNRSAPQPNTFDGRLCCQVNEVCTNGVDDDGDGLVDCADPACNGASASGALNPFNVTKPQVCRPSQDQCPTTLHEGLVGFWQFENSSEDGSGEANDAKLKGNASYTSLVNGSNGRAARFDGEGDRVDVASLNTPYGAWNDGEVSVSLWAKWAGPSGSTDSNGRLTLLNAISDSQPSTNDDDLWVNLNTGGSGKFNVYFDDLN
ncbi:MAG: hypothetical protein ABEL51_16375, partial [Salinibacter sp.]